MIEVEFEKILWRLTRKPCIRKKDAAQKPESQETGINRQRAKTAHELLRQR